MADSPSSAPEPPPDDLSTHDSWMAHALDLARAAEAVGEVPVGAVLVRGGVILAEGSNRTVRDSDPTAHAEVVAIRSAGKVEGDWRLLDTTLYVTLEPCAMCAGAIVLARIPRVVFATHDPKAGMGGSLSNLLQDDRLNHRCEIVTGIRAGEASSMLKAFFKARR